MSRQAMYARPRNLDQAAALLGALDTGAMVIAGGQELMPYINYGHLEPAVLVDISGLKELGGISTEPDGTLAIGALTVHRDIARSEAVAAAAPLLAHAATLIGGGRQVHNRGTIGGNIVAMNTLYDIIPPLLALNAEVEVMRDEETRRVALSALLAETSHGLGAAAILTRVLVPAQPASGRWAYEKLKITEGAYASANAAVVAQIDGEHAFTHLRLAVGAAGDRPQDMSAVAAMLLGKPWSPQAAAQLEHKVAETLRDPLDDQRGGADYRRAMAGVVARRAINAALDAD